MTTVAVSCVTTRAGLCRRRRWPAANWPSGARSAAVRRPALHDRAGKPLAGSHVIADAATGMLDNGRLRVHLDTRSGGIVELYASGIQANLVDSASGYTLNDYLYLLGDDLSGLQRNDPVKVTVRDRGPLVASLLVESGAPGCHKLTREIRLVAGSDYVELFDTVDKKRLEAAELYRQRGQGKCQLRLPLPRTRWRDTDRHAVRGHPSRTRSDARRLQELAERGPLGRGGQRGLRQ